MKKTLFLGSGSAKDPGFDSIQIQNQPYKEYMKKQGINVIDRVIESCHGCPTRMKKYSAEMQSLTTQGHRVVAVLEGGLYFALPSLQATQTTFPIISVPMDFPSYQAHILPPGHATIASVGVNPLRADKSTYSNAQDEQKVKALTLAERVLNLENPTVNLLLQYEQHDKKLRSALQDLGIEFEEGDYRPEAMSVAYGNPTTLFDQGSFLIRADPDLNPKDWDPIIDAEKKHHEPGFNQIPTAETYHPKNLAIFAAKVLSLQRPKLRETLREIALKKVDSYPPERDLVQEVREMKWVG